jgi:hypothetical protein
MKRAERGHQYSRQVNELNELLKEVGFTNGIADVSASNVSSYFLSEGATGNMGSGKLNYIYCRMGNDFKGWRVRSDNGCSITFLAACGNAFYPGAYVAPMSAAIVPEEKAPEKKEAKEECCEVRKRDCCYSECDPCAYHHRRMYRRSCCSY